MITSVVEDQTDHVPPEFLFPAATTAAIARHDWLVPDYADADGRVGIRVQAFVLQIAGRTLVVDPCVGNHKVRALPIWNKKSWPFLERLAAAGFSPEDVDTVVHTHLHA
ncbi:MAG: MBL fold metallo-hydrolase, partial [Acidimicrobiia bacterium]